MRIQNALLLFLIGISLSLSAQDRVYFNDFETGPYDVADYTGAPDTDPNISVSVWTNDSPDNFSEQVGFNGTKGIGVSGSGTIVITFEIQVDPGYQLDITGYNFWVRKTKANSDWKFDVQGVQYADGESTLEGNNVSGSIAGLTNLRQPLNVTFTVNGQGNGFYVIDNFEILGKVRPICDDPLITAQPQDDKVCSGNTASFSVEANSFPGSTVTYQWQVDTGSGTWENLVNDANYSGVNTNNLTIADTPLAFNQNNYRCLVQVDNCAEESTAAVLTVYTLPETKPIIHTN